MKKSRPFRQKARKIPELKGNRPKPGSTPGVTEFSQIDVSSLNPKASKITCIDFGVELTRYPEILDLESFLKDTPLKEGMNRWINVDATDLKTLICLEKFYQLHPLAIEDAFHTPQRTKLDVYDLHLFLIVHQLQMQSGEDVQAEQVSLFILDRVLITIQQNVGDVWNPVRERLCKEGSKIRKGDAGFLAYALLDALVDHYYPILDIYSERLEQIDLQMSENPSPEVLNRLHEIKRDFLLMRKNLWPVRDLISHLLREEHDLILPVTKVYLKDVYDHVVQLIDTLETYRDICIEQREVYLGLMSQKLNEVMKFLTMISTLFIPLSFLAGVYGMNFKYFPELEMENGYLYFWTICLLVVGILVGIFKKKKWL